MLIVEDGSNVAGSDSYISESDAIARAAVLGLPFPATEAASTIPLRQAAIYLEQYRNRYQGKKIYSDQSLQWPRDPVYIDNIYNEPDNIPQNLIDAQISITSEVFVGAPIYGTAAGSPNNRKVGDVSVTNSNSGRLDNSAYLGFTNELLKPLFKNPSVGGLEFPVCRA